MMILTLPTYSVLSVYTLRKRASSTLMKTASNLVTQ